MNKKAIQFLAEAISEVGAWQWWDTSSDMFQMEFCDVLLYDDTKAEKEPHTSTIALRFYDHSFAIFLDNLNDDQDKKWYDRFHDDEIKIIELESEGFAFNDIEFARSLLKKYKNTIPIKIPDSDDPLTAARHMIVGNCGDVGFIVGGDKIKVIGNKGEYSGKEIISAAIRWWDYWRAYWQKRGTEDAYMKDYACEVTIPISKEEPIGKYYPEE